MARPTHPRRSARARPSHAWLVGCLALAVSGAAISAQSPADRDTADQAPAQQNAEPQAQPEPSQAAPAEPAQDAGAGTPIAPIGSQPAPGKRQLREAEDAYLAGAKKLERDDLDAAEREFKRALALNPEDRDYAIAISVTRQHKVTELVQQAGKAQQSGDHGRAQTLLAEAREIDPQNPIVIEHTSQLLLQTANPRQPPNAASPQTATPGSSAGSAASNPLASRVGMLAGSDAPQPWRIQAPALAGAIRLTPSDAAKSFHLRGDSQEVLRQVASAYGIRTTFDDSVEHKNVRFDLEDARYAQAIRILSSMTHVFIVPLDETSVLVAKDDLTIRLRLERQLQETIYLPGMTPDQINEVANIVRTIFGVTQAIVQTSLQSIVVRAPEDVIAPMNRALDGLLDDTGEVMIEVKLYEVDTTRMNSVGATLPTQAGVYSVAQAASALVTANQALVTQAIAQGLISSTASNLDIALALIGSGLVQSTLGSSTIGTIGNGLTLLGITGSTNTAFNLGMNSSDTRTLDDVQLRADDRQPTTFREGTRYPITTSKYTTGLSTAASSLSNASINGVSVASLLSQYAGGTSTTIPQVTYEDLGVTLDATPTIQKSGRINLLLKLKIESLGGSSANGIPILESHQFNSDITLADGDSAMMVSAVSRTETAAMTGIPLLSELPGFQLPVSDNTEKDTSQLVVLVTPHVVRRRSDTLAGPRILIPPRATN